MTITKTIALDGSGDALGIQDAFDLCLNDGNDYVLEIQDYGPYEEQAVLAARAAGGVVTLKAKTFDCYKRPVITMSGVDGVLLDMRASHVINGIRFVYDENTQGLADRICVKAADNLLRSEVSHCEFHMAGRYYWSAAPPGEWGHIGYWAGYHVRAVTVYNNLFRRCGFIGVRIDPTTGDTINIWNNTFVKCQEALFIESLNSGPSITVKSNIFDLDRIYDQDCNKFYCIFVNDYNKSPALIDGLDYNFYNFRNRALAVEMWLYWSGTSHDYLDLAALKAAFPALEVNGNEDDPTYCIYCQDYRLRGISPPIGKGLAMAGVTDDIDGYPRLTPTAAGCYEFNPAVMPETFFPMPDAGDQSDPFDIVGEDQTVAR